MSSRSILSRLDDEKESVRIYDALSTELNTRARRSMLAFTRRMNPDYRINWHHVRTCNALDRFTRYEITRLMIFMPPQVGKSELVSRNLPPFIFGQDPDHRIIAAAYGDSFASEFNLDAQRIMDTEEYREIFPDTKIPTTGVEGRWVRNSSRFDIVGRRGRYNSLGVGGSATGKTGYTLLIDDPVKNEKEVRSQAYRDDQYRWFKSVARTRLRRDKFGNPPRILLTMTRWHHDDLAARLLAEAKANPLLPQWTVLSFPMVRETMEDPGDPRKLDQALWPEMVSRSDCEELMTDTRTWTALYQQRPSPEKGAIFQRDWWKYYKSLPELEKQVQSWDLTFTEGPSTDWVVGQVWGKIGPRRYLVDQFRARVGFNGQLQAIRAMSGRHPLAMAKLIEKAANGHAAQQTLSRELQGIILVPAKGSKVVRAEAISPQVQAGNVFLPDPSIAPWIKDFVEETAQFPFGTHDDQVDAMSQALSHLADSSHVPVLPIQITGPSKWTKY